MVSRCTVYKCHAILPLWYPQILFLENNSQQASIIIIIIIRIIYRILFVKNIPTLQNKNRIVWNIFVYFFISYTIWIHKNTEHIFSNRHAMSNISHALSNTILPQSRFKRKNKIIIIIQTLGFNEKKTPQESQ